MIYFIEAVGAGRIKIGYTNDGLKARIADLSTASAFPLRVLATSPGSLKLERELHLAFRNYRARREWFHANETLVDLCERASAAELGDREALLHEACAAIKRRRELALPSADDVMAMLKGCQRSFVERHGVATTSALTGKSPAAADRWRRGDNLICLTSAARMIRFDREPFAPFLAQIAETDRLERIEREAAAIRKELA